MLLSPGDKLGPYEILARIGAGGMGEVYKARDTRLGREVAVKVSKEQFSERFEREARAVAALNHPNICTLHDVGQDYLVMELIEGPTLADRIREGPIRLDEATEIARQMAAALEAAHEKGIVHRDLKPGNVKIRPAGSVKVLDFGLAKYAESSEVTADSPTMLSHVGMILGTAAYMAPEQARGKSVDKRADIWSFGVVFYEMLTGKRLFQGEDLTETLASVVKEQPDLSAAPPEVRRLLRKCLEKDPGKRLRDIGDVWELLEDAGKTPSAAPEPAAFGSWGKPAAISTAAAAVFAIALGALAFVHFHRPAEPAGTAVRFQIPAPQVSGVGTPRMSPDGTQVIYGDGKRLWVRAFDSFDARSLPGTDGMTVGQPFWSADSRSVFFPAGGMLRRADLSGGTPQTICTLPGLLQGGFAVGDRRIVFFSFNAGAFEVTASGGAASPLKTVPQDAGPLLAEFTDGAMLPDGNHFIFNSPRQNGGIYVGSLNGHEEAKRLLPDQSAVAWAPSTPGGAGYLLFIRDGTLVAQSFNPSRLELSGSPIPLIRQVSAFSASPAGALVYRGGVSATTLKWFDRQGKSQENIGAPGLYGELAISPNGSRVAFVHRSVPVKTHIHDFATEATSTLTPNRNSVKPVWSPDGTRIAFAGSTANRLTFDLWEAPSGGGGDGQLLLQSDVLKYPWDWSADGRWLVYSAVDPGTKEDLWILPMQGEHKPQPFLMTDYTETDAAFSPDGRFIAYVSDESGKFEVYVRSFPAAAGGKWTVSAGGGYQPRWRRDGKELFYFAADGRLMSVDVTPGAAFRAGTPKFLFQAPIFGGGATTGNHYWDVAPDGQRFLINTADSAGASTAINVVLNWQAELRK